MTHRFSFSRRLMPVVLLATLVVAALVGTRISTIHAQSAHQSASAPQVLKSGCQGSICTFQLQVNPGLLAGQPFACPAIQHAQAHIVITNRFVTGALNDIMVLTASGLPRNTGFDMFLVQHSPLDAGTFPGFGFGWYQSDVQSDSNGHAQVRVQGILREFCLSEKIKQPEEHSHLDAGPVFCPDSCRQGAQQSHAPQN